MGDVKKPRKQFSSPRNPWKSEDLSQELYLVGTYGLRNKRELWKAKTELSRVRKQARELLAAPAEVRAKQEAKLLKYLNRIGVLGETATPDDILGLSIENFLDRRLQTVVWKKGLARTPFQARQMITHGHIVISDRRVTIPGYTVKGNEDLEIRLRPGSTMTVVPAEQGPAQEQAGAAAA
ncbi:MAG: 30S ribosomal protein S4 [Thaumarchaeota archaeon]|nr:30S ribosomal protein S4 [Nitrososphaerota archaeon]